MRFTKMHGIGNDYVYVNAFVETVADPAAVARAVSDRHFGIGSDGLILVAPPTEAGLAGGAEVRMRMFNADGSESEMCGNGVRCVAKYAFDHGITKSNPVRIETGRGVLTLALSVEAGKVAWVTVDMGEPILESAKVPVDVSRLRSAGKDVYEIDTGVHGKFLGTFVSMGNPHVTIYVPDVKAVDLEKVGPVLENHPAFPRRINVHFVQVVSDAEVVMRTWERGSGITLACGTGACAVAVAGVLTGRGGRKVLAHLPGGDLRLEWKSGDGRVLMTGPATEVFSGDWTGGGLS